ncbi:MAG TPA: DUF2520 domain-containing protein [Marinilabiliaceae bacterium]|nr:DUF2520 domain-containing protein [Marinilabiliaceae bacterium]
MTIVIIGSGNVATHLALALTCAGKEILQVYSRTLLYAEQLANRVGAEPIDDLNDLTLDADTYLISVADASIEEVVQKMPFVKGVVAHTAASIGMFVLSRFTHHGVFYPFQTFTKEKPLDFKEIPLLLEANGEATLTVLKSLGEAISDKVQESNESKRKALHIAAVFACNFVNHLYALADGLLMESEMDFGILAPLIRETTDKALSMHPQLAQTGPAHRSDTNVIASHLKNLGEGTMKYEIYQLLSQSIMKAEV